MSQTLLRKADIPKVLEMSHRAHYTTSCPHFVNAASAIICGVSELSFHHLTESNDPFHAPREVTKQYIGKFKSIMLDEKLDITDER